VDDIKIALYVLTFNSPSQFENLCKSFEIYDCSFLNNPKKYLINNSTDEKTFQHYDVLCYKYGFEELHKNNLGICGGRQFVAEHFDENGFDFYFFFEDDMAFYIGEDKFCKNGFPRKIDDFYKKNIDICHKEGLDFLKWNFTEFYGDNSRQWAWYNVTQYERQHYFPENPNRTENDYGKEPFTKFKNIKSYMGLIYATGEIYYCNWPQIVSKNGNKKMFLETKWDSPHETTWMSDIFKKTVNGYINTGILLATPSEHHRFEFYSSEQRKEN
jgi:hypothetical protein